MFALVAIRIY